MGYYIVLIALVVALGGFVFGVDSGKAKLSITLLIDILTSS
jgi:hypothetical protein